MSFLGPRKHWKFKPLSAFESASGMTSASLAAGGRILLARRPSADTSASTRPCWTRNLIYPHRALRDPGPFGSAQGRLRPGLQLLSFNSAYEELQEAICI